MSWFSFRPFLTCFLSLPHVVTLVAMQNSSF
jgi:hypothetical protein